MKALDRTVKKNLDIGTIATKISLYNWRNKCVLPGSEYQLTIASFFYSDTRNFR